MSLSSRRLAAALLAFWLTITSSVPASAAVGGIASSATSQLLTTGSINGGQLLKAGATAALTAGLLNVPITEGGESLNQLAGIKDVAGTGSRLANFDVENLGRNLAGIAARGVVNAGVNQLVYGREAGSFGTALRNSIVSDLAAVGANAIGQTWGGGKDPLMQTVAHAVLGGTAAKLTGKDAVAGAIGGASESILGNLIDLPTDEKGNYSTTTQAFYTGSAMLIGGAVSQAAGHDAVTAAAAAQNAAQNNRLATQVEKDRFRQLAKDDPVKAERYQEAACTLIKCSALFPEGSAQRRYWEQAELRGALNTAELRELRQVQASDPSFLKYGFFDKVGDVTWRGVERGAQIVDFAGQTTVNAVKTTVVGTVGTTKETIALTRDTLVSYGNTMAYAAGDDNALKIPIEPQSQVVKSISEKGFVQTTVDAGTSLIVAATNLPRGIGAGDPVMAGEGLAFLAPLGIASLDSLVARATAGSSEIKVVGEVGAKGGATALADTQGALTQQVADLRATLTGNAKTSGNVCVAQIDIPGVQSTMAASSQIDVPTAAQQTLGVVGKVPETFPSSVVPTAGKNPYPLLRDVDSEAKILNNVAAQLGENTSASGTINLLTERAPCASCSNIIQQFQAKYPNIKINVMDNGGVISPTKKGP